MPRRITAAVALLCLLGAVAAQPRGSSYTYNGVKDRSRALGTAPPPVSSSPVIFVCVCGLCCRRGNHSLNELPDAVPPYLSSLSPTSGVREGNATLTISARPKPGVI